MADFAADALALADHLSWQRFALVGVSFGGMVAQELAIAAPERVTRMVLACTSSGGAGGSSAPLHEVFSLPQRQRAERLIGLVDARTATDPLLRAQISDRLAAVLADPDAGARRQLEARRHHDTFARLGADRPRRTLVAAGRYDELAPLANSRALAARSRARASRSSRAATHSWTRTPAPGRRWRRSSPQASRARSASTPSQTSTKRVVSGERPKRITSGARKSASTPRAASRAQSSCASGWASATWAPRRARVARRGDRDARARASRASASAIACSVSAIPFARIRVDRRRARRARRPRSSAVQREDRRGAREERRGCPPRARSRAPSRTGRGGPSQPQIGWRSASGSSART